MSRWKLKVTSREAMNRLACANLFTAAIFGANWLANIGASWSGYVALAWFAMSAVNFWRASATNTKSQTIPNRVVLD